jgi:ParB/RepB/Spo0J family partition protein
MTDTLEILKDNGLSPIGDEQKAEDRNEDILRHRALSGGHQTNVVRVAINDVKTDSSHRKIDEAAVADLAKSMSLIGLQTPITVWAESVGSGYRLVAGGHRLKAAAKLGWRNIPAVVQDGDENAAELWRISENLHRKELSTLEEAAELAKWVGRVGQIKGQVVPQSGAGRPEGAIARAARTLPLPGKSVEAREKAARRALQINSIRQDAKNALKKAGLDDNQAALLEVARRPADEQLAKVAELATRKASESGSVAPPQTSSDSDGGPSDHGGSADLGALIKADSRFDLLVLRLQKKQAALLRANYVNPKTALEEWLPLHRVRAKDSAMVVVARLADFPAIVDRLLPVCGFKGPARVFLAHPPVESEVTDIEVIIVAECGSGLHFAGFDSDQWKSGKSGPFDALAVAASLYPDARRKLHGLASTETEGWTCLVGAHSWLKEPTVR